MHQQYKDALMVETLRRALSTMILIHAGKLEVDGTGYFIDLTSDIERLKSALLLLDNEVGSTH
jgi:hypothetical protein